MCLLKKAPTPAIVLALGIGMWGAADYATGMESIAAQIGVLVGAAIVVMVVGIYFVFVK